MSRLNLRRSHLLLAWLALAAAVVGTASVAQAAYRDPTMDLPRATSGTRDLGPHFPYVQVIMINTVIPLKDEAIINRTENGYLFRAGQQNTDLTVTLTDGRLRFVDRGTRSWKWLPAKWCERLEVPQGVGASCRVPARFTTVEPMLLEVWPRLGDDVVDTSAVPALIDVSILGDRGHDVAHLGAGNDFVNGAQDSDRVFGGAGNDWIRTGENDDVLEGGAGDDYLVGVDADDTVDGGPGDDRVYGSDGNDKLVAGDGQDLLGCGNGKDIATFKSTDRSSGCEAQIRQ